MIWALILIVFLLWVVGGLADIAGNVIHILLVIALGLLIYRLLRRP